MLGVGALLSEFAHGSRSLAALNDHSCFASIALSQFIPGKHLLVGLKSYSLKNTGEFSFCLSTGKVCRGNYYCKFPHAALATSLNFNLNGPALEESS